MKILNSYEDNELLKEDFEKADKFIFKVIMFQWFLVSTLGGLLYGNYLFGFVAGSLLGIVSIIAYKYYAGSQLLRVVNAVILMLFSLILIQQNLGRIEMHFHIFVMLSFLVVYKDILPVFAASLFTIIHHLLFTYLQLNSIQISNTDIIIYNYGCGFDIALVHAFFVLLEFGILTRLIFVGINRHQEMLKDKEEIDKSHKRINDSIEYASLIQHALLPKENILNKYTKENYTFWQPKDTVGGDIYFIIELDSKKEFLLIVIDGAGHGVSGAFVTMLVKAIQTQIAAKISSKELERVPSKILEFFNISIKTMLNQEKGSHSDAGFDGGVLYYNKQTNVCKYSGAKTPLYIVNNEDLEVIKSDRKNVGFIRTKIDEKYTDYDIDIKEDTQLYIATDGIMDQEGLNNTRYGRKEFERFLIRNSNNTMNNQKKELISVFKNFKKQLEQTDDITIIGLKF